VHIRVYIIVGENETPGTGAVERNHGDSFTSNIYSRYVKKILSFPLCLNTISLRCNHRSREAKI
jgi:hypothetical protein